MPSTRLADAHPELQLAWPEIVDEYEATHPGKTLLVTCTYRAPAEQQALYAQGRTLPGQIVTHCDGVTTISNHNRQPARALDFAVLIAGKVTWDPWEYAPVGMLAEARGLVWGGSWRTFKDYPHVELPEGALRSTAA